MGTILLLTMQFEGLVLCRLFRGKLNVFEVADSRFTEIKSIRHLVNDKEKIGATSF